jgi:hypothetical protein
LILDVSNPAVLSFKEATDISPAATSEASNGATVGGAVGGALGVSFLWDTYIYVDMDTFY